MAMDPETRIYYYEEYSIFQIIELAAEAAGHNLGSQNLVHLCNNELIALVLYDKKNGTNLVTVLQSYLLHERNTSETAKALYIHRNTMLYKIHKIEEIIGCSLEDPMLRERMLFSCRVLEYMTKYRKEDILVLKRSKMNAEMK
jgi:DNA-binding PucR family transcriptional regulator